MSQLQTFNHEMFGELPVVVVNGFEWFGGTEAAKALSFSKPHDALKNHVDEDDSMVHGVGVRTGVKIDGTPAIQTVRKKFVNESGLYSLIFGAAKQGNNLEIQEKAKKFKRWVTSEVLPTIRKSGGYVSKNREEEFIKNYFPSFSEEVKRAMVLDLRQQNQILNKKIEELKPKADYADLILKNKGLVAINQIAKDYGMSAQEMNKLLHNLKVQYKQGKQWLLYSKYAAEGYVHSETISITRSDGRPDVTMNTKWTQKGRLFIYKLLKSNNILPVIERKLAEAN